MFLAFTRVQTSRSIIHGMLAMCYSVGEIGQVTCLQILFHFISFLLLARRQGQSFVWQVKSSKDLG